MKNTAIKPILQHASVLALFLLLSILYFYPQLQGKVIPQHDILSHKWMSHELQEFEARTGEVSHWTNSMFGGMPAYQISSPVRSNLLKYLEDAANLFFDRPIGYFFAMMLGVYVLLVLLGTHWWVAALGAVAFGLTTNNFILFGAGHMSKLRAIAFLAPIVAGVILTYRGKFLTGGTLFATALGIDIYVNHPQMTYYLALSLIAYVLWQFVSDLKAGQLAQFAKASVVLLIGTGLAVGASLSKLWSTYEYSKDTMRGEPILESTGEITSSSQTKGLEWGYAMQWSNGALDVVSGFIPGVVGGSSQEPVAKDAELMRFLRNAPNAQAPYYWGPLPFTSGPPYFGAVTVFLFVLGLFLVKGQLKGWLGVAALLTTLISMGSHFEILNRLLFDYFPMYNNFRAHNSAMAVTALFLPVLGALAVQQVISGEWSSKGLLKGLYWATGIAGSIALFFAMLGPSFFDFSNPGDAQYQQAASALVNDRKALMRSDALRSLLLVLAAAGLIWAFIHDKLTKTPLLAGLALLIAGDLWFVGKRYLNNDSFVSESEYERNFLPRAVDNQILQDPAIYYRVLDLSVNTFNSAQPSYFHKTIGGYHAAKLQRYQDMIEYHITKGNQAVLDMLNTKYIIGQDQKVQMNPGALGNAWFVGEIKQVPNANGEIEALTGFNPAQTAVVHLEFADYIKGLNPDKSGQISLKSYAPNKLVYDANVPANDQLAVFSEIWYGPNKGWKVSIDGQIVDHIRVNYCLRGLKVPAGNHEIVFEFDPDSFKTGETISYISSALILFSFLGMIVYSSMGWYNQLPEHEPEMPKREKTLRKIPKPKKK